MIDRARPVALAALLVLGLHLPLHAAEPYVFDQSNFNETALDIGTWVAADDFDITEAVRLTRATVWLQDIVANDNGLLDSFDGVLGFAIYADAGGLPGAAPIATGRSTALVQVDQGDQAAGNLDIVLVSFDLDPPVALAPGTTYWFALKEGLWGEASDEDMIQWQGAPKRGAAARSAMDEGNPGSWFDNFVLDAAFVLYGEPTPWEQSELEVSPAASNATDVLHANDFTLPAATSVSAAEVWLVDDDAVDDGLLASFSGVVGWGLFADNGVDDVPGALIAFGTDAAPTQTDTGGQSDIDTDVVRVRFRFGRSVALPAGTSWLAVREGAWGSEADETVVWWAHASAVVGSPVRGTSQLTDPQGWGAGPADLGFALFEELLFASGFEAGVVCAWSARAGGGCP